MNNYLNYLHLALIKFINSIIENGFFWTYLSIKRKFTWKMFSKNEIKLKEYESKNNIKGLNTILQNVNYWNRYNWDKLGEEWTPSKNWKENFIINVINKYINSNSVILEVGPGGGRFTEFLIPNANKLWLVDVSEKCLKLCSDRFAPNINIQYIKLTEINLDFLENESLDVVFSFDVFVHLDPKNVDEYFGEFKKVLKPNGAIIINIPTKGNYEGNFISKLSFNVLREIAIKNEFNIIKIIEQRNFKEIQTYELYGCDRVILILKRE